MTTKDAAFVSSLDLAVVDQTAPVACVVGEASALQKGRPSKRSFAARVLARAEWDVSNKNRYRTGVALGCLDFFP